MHIDIGPSNILTTSKILIYPVIPADLFLYNLRDSVLYYTFTNEILDRSSDDGGLYFRLHVGITDTVHNYMNKFGITDILLGCAKKQEESPDISNVLIIYDMFNEGAPVDAHLCNRACQSSALLIRPPFEVIHKDHIFKPYIEEYDIISFGGSKFPRPLICRNFISDSASYKLIDPYLQWSPPKFWYHRDFIDTIPDNIEGWISNIVESFNWDYFYALVNDNDYKIADMEDLAASIFDIIYEEYLYFGISKKLWCKEKPTRDQHYQLLGDGEKQVLINFTDIVNSIRQVLSDRLLKDNLLVSDDSTIDSTDYESVEDSFNTLFDSMETDK